MLTVRLTVRLLPWTTNLYTETLIERVQVEFGEKFWGFWMLGGMSGGGMGFIFAPEVKSAAQDRLQLIMSETKGQLEQSVPFAMEPVVYDFSINERGSYADLFTGDAALMPPAYYPLTIPGLLRLGTRELSVCRRAELDRLGAACRTEPQYNSILPKVFDRLLPSDGEAGGGSRSLTDRLDAHGFDRVQHAQIRTDLQSGRIGLAQNRLPVNSQIEDVREGDVVDATSGLPKAMHDLGADALAAGSVAVVSLAGGIGSRWTSGAGVIKALSPFCKISGKHRTFLEVHLAKSRRIGRMCGTHLPHVITTSYLTHTAIESFLRTVSNYGYPGSLVLSPGRMVGLRLVPMARDLRFDWEEMPQQQLDEQAQKLRESLRSALISWAIETGEASDYTDNLPNQCLHPVGHWYEIPNLLRNGTLADLLSRTPHLKYLMAHNVDTLGADVDLAILGHHIDQGAAMTTEVITRRIEDRGGGLARIDGKLRLVEGLALAR